MKKVDWLESGKTFGRWTIIRKHITEDHHREKRYWCRCVCGSEKVVHHYNLTLGKSKSCGCLSAELTSKRQATHGQTRDKKFSKLYNAWAGMRNRCRNVKGNRAKSYVLKGIRVCDEWDNSFEVFARDMGPHPGEGFSLDRIDNNKGYFKENCRWSTPSEQGYNTSSNVVVGGKKICDLANESGIKPSIIRSRLNAGWSLERALTEPPRISPGLRRKEIKQYAELTGFPESLILYRFKVGWSIDRILTQPMRIVEHGKHVFKHSKYNGDHNVSEAA